MGKNTHFLGQPVFSQLLSLIPRPLFSRVVSAHRSDRYYKTFDTCQHLVSMLFCCFSGASSLRELSTGLLAWQNRLIHIGMPKAPLLIRVVMKAGIPIDRIILMCLCMEKEVNC